MGRRWGAAACLAVLFSLSLQACGGSPHEAKDTLRIPVYGAVHVPDPAVAWSSSDQFVDSLLYSGLVKFSPDLHIIPDLAVSIPTISSSGLTYTFTIRRDARFADGRHCTAWDVAYSLARALRVGGWNARHDLGGIDGVAAVERGEAADLEGVDVLHRLSLRIHLSYPDADFLQKLAFPAASVVDRRVVLGHRMRRWPVAATGTGPWMLSAHAPDGTLSLVPRRHFYGNTLQVRSLLLLPVRDAAAGLALYKKNALDVALVPQTGIAKASGQGDFHRSTALSAYYAVPLSGRALPLAANLDRDRMIRDSGLALSPLDVIVPPTVPDYVSSPPAIGATSDPPADALPISVTAASPGDRTEQILRQALLRQWSGSGKANADRPPVQIRIVHIFHTLPSPGLWIRLVLPQTGSRWLRDSLNTAQTLTNDPVDRMNVYDQCERWSLEKGFVIPLAVDSLAYLIRPSVQGLEVTPMGVMPQDDNWPSVTVT